MSVKPTCRSPRTAQVPAYDTGKAPARSTCVQKFRRRMECVGNLIRQWFGDGPPPDPEEVARDAYLVVVGRLIEALTAETDGPSTAELTALSKALAEQRRLDLVKMELDRKHPQTMPHDDTPDNGSTAPPAGFGRMVKQIYGTDVDRPSNAPETGG